MSSPDHTTERNEVSRPRVSRSVAAPAEAVWAVLSDGWQYATWVVGASRCDCATIAKADKAAERRSRRSAGQPRARASRSR